MTGSATALARLTAFVARESERLGADRAELLRRAGLSEEALRDPDRRLQVRLDLRLWLAMLELLPDPKLGLRLAERLEARDLGLVGYLMRNSPTVREALERLTRFSRILDETYPPELRVRGGEAVYSSDSVAYPIARLEPVADWELAAVVTLVRRLAGRPVDPKEVRFPYPRPADVTAHRALFRASLVFDQARLEIVFHRADLELSVVGADQELGRYLERHAETVVAALVPEGTVAQKVERALWTGMKEGRISLTEVAKQLAMSGRSLQRRLESEGTTFASERDAFRREMAMSLLRERDLAIWEVAFLLGYSEPSTFYRAFRRWTGSSPRRFRAAFDRRSDSPGA